MTLRPKCPKNPLRRLRLATISPFIFPKTSPTPPDGHMASVFPGAGRRISPTDDRCILSCASWQIRPGSDSDEFPTSRKETNRNSVRAVQRRHMVRGCGRRGFPFGKPRDRRDLRDRRRSGPSRCEANPHPCRWPGLGGSDEGTPKPGRKITTICDHFTVNRFGSCSVRPLNGRYRP